MDQIKPIIFAGGTRERSSIILNLASELQHISVLHPWWSSTAFKATAGTLDGLLNATKKYDFAVFFLTSDDFIRSRDVESYTSRDNVLFEFGLFLGSLGPKRVMAFAQDERDRPLKVPSDLLGVTIPRFVAGDADEVAASMVVVRDTVEKTIRAEGPRSFELVISWDIDTARRRFIAQLGPRRMQMYGDKIRDRELLLVCRKHDPFVSTGDDRAIIIGVPRVVDPTESEVMLSVDLAGRFDDMKRGDVLNGYLFLLPRRHDLSHCATIRDLVDHGCLQLDRDFGLPIE